MGQQRNPEKQQAAGALPHRRRPAGPGRSGLPGHALPAGAPRRGDIGRSHRRSAIDRLPAGREPPARAEGTAEDAHGARECSKRDRQQLLADLIRTRSGFRLRPNCVAALQERPAATVTQATVSRDMREMGVQKGTDARWQGCDMSCRRPGCAAIRRRSWPGCSAMRPPRRQPARTWWSCAREPGTGAGGGPGHRRARQRQEVIGTVAGDDTVMLVLADSDGAARNGELSSMI